MTYQVLARRCRPRTFAELIGQEATCRAITNSLNQQRLHHAYLFTGTRGVGKTTIARLLAKAVNCEQGISAQPCLSCNTCVAIEQGKFVDLLEIDAASRTRVEDTKELLENIQYAPSIGRFKIYLIDEVHMLSTHSFNALLKTLEEPPKHIKFILATTEIDKLPNTILSRCLQFSLKPIAPSLIQSQLSSILTQEKITYEDSALELIAAAADGSMRDGLSILDQAIAYAKDTSISKADIQTILGHTHIDYALDLLQALIQKTPEKIFKITQNIALDGGNFNYVLDNLLRYCHQICIYLAIKPEHLHIKLNAKLIKIAQQCTAEDIQLFYQIALKGKEDLGLAPSTMVGFEMTLLRMHAFKLSVPVEHEPKTLLSSNPVAPEPVVSTPSTQSALPWGELIPKLKLTGLAKNAAEQAEWVEKLDNTISLRIDKSHETIFNHIITGKIEKSLSDYFKQKIQLQLLADKPVQESPAQIKQQNETQKTQETIEVLNKDPMLSDLEKTFNATWTLESVQK